MHTGAPGDPGSGLENLLSYLEQAYYHQLEQLCGEADSHIAALHDGDVHQTASLYTSLAKKLTGQIAHYVRLRRFALIPYLNELIDKEDEGHDCRSCSSRCTVRHSAQVEGIRDAHTRIRETLNRLRSVDLGTGHEAPYRSLCATISSLDTTLTELFQLEESSLVPRVLEAQTAIHARS